LVALILLAVLLGTSVWRLFAPPTLTVPPAHRLIFNDAIVINPGRDTTPWQTLTIESGRIASITGADTTPKTPETMACRGCFVLPGLIDMHGHFPNAPDHRLFALLFLAHGVTTVRDAGNFDGQIWTTRHDIQTGVYPGPRIAACGPLLNGDPPLWPGSRVVHNATEARQAVTERVAEGADCVKVYSNLTSGTLAAIVAAAVEHNLPVIGSEPRQGTPRGIAVA